MTIQSINGTERTHHNALATLGQGALWGAAAGYAGKYVLPLTHEEKNSDEYVKVTEKIRKQKTEYSVRTEKYLDGMKAKKNRSLAEDEFIKLFDGMKEGDHVKPSRIRKAIKTLEAKNPLEALDFKNICKEIIMLLKGFLKRKVYQLIHQCTGK